jgi:hypothetical protein
VYLCVLGHVWRCDRKLDGEKRAIVGDRKRKSLVVVLIGARVVASPSFFFFVNETQAVNEV